MSSGRTRFEAEFARGLAERDANQLRRHLVLPRGLDLTSNDYLGYAGDVTIATAMARAAFDHGPGAGAARLLRGHLSLHADVEAELAAFCGQEAALLFPSGWSANTGLLPALVGPDDVVVSDSLNHASLIDGIRLSRARCVVVPHGDLDALHDALRRRPTAGRCLVVTESLFSMDGDLSDLQTICALADRYGAAVVVDEAHATGLYGARGAGRVEALGLQAQVLATVHTGGKALGVGGAWVAGSRLLVDWLVQRARSFVFSTAVVPALAAGVQAAVRKRATDHAKITDLHAKAARLRDRLRHAGLDLGPSASAVIPVVLGTNARALHLASALQAEGFDVRAVRPPTVPTGTARLRVTVRAPVPEAELQRFADRLLVHAEPA